MHRYCSMNIQTVQVDSETQYDFDSSTQNVRAGEHYSSYSISDETLPFTCSIESRNCHNRPLERSTGTFSFEYPFISTTARSLALLSSFLPCILHICSIPGGAVMNWKRCISIACNSIFATAPSHFQFDRIPSNCYTCKYYSYRTACICACKMYFFSLHSCTWKIVKHTAKRNCEHIWRQKLFARQTAKRAKTHE